ncbi:MAG: nitroreductase family protein [Actinobacteria bacterium]|nr:nitroreductase family protein [Actinomycetota bacterium]
MDTRLAIASKRDQRRYAKRPVDGVVVERILDAGRVTGSSRNTQKWEFVLVADKAALAEAVYAPENVATAGLVIAIVGEAASFDVGRCAQNMFLAAWDQGVVSCPNGVKDADLAAAICGGEVKAVLSFGWPVRELHVEDRSVEEWSAQANRKSLDELVRRV